MAPKCKRSFNPIHTHECDMSVFVRLYQYSTSKASKASKVSTWMAPKCRRSFQPIHTHESDMSCVWTAAICFTACCTTQVVNCVRIFTAVLAQQVNQQVNQQRVSFRDADLLADLLAVRWFTCSFRYLSASADLLAASAMCFASKHASQHACLQNDTHDCWAALALLLQNYLLYWYKSSVSTATMRFAACWKPTRTNVKRDCWRSIKALLKFY